MGRHLRKHARMRFWYQIETLSVISLGIRCCTIYHSTKIIIDLYSEIGGELTNPEEMHSNRQSAHLSTIGGVRWLGGWRSQIILVIADNYNYCLRHGTHYPAVSLLWRLLLQRISHNIISRLARDGLEDYYYCKASLRCWHKIRKPYLYVYPTWRRVQLDRLNHISSVCVCQFIWATFIYIHLEMCSQRQSNIFADTQVRVLIYILSAVSTIQWWLVMMDRALKHVCKVKLACVPLKMWPTTVKLLLFANCWAFRIPRFVRVWMNYDAPPWLRTFISNETLRLTIMPHL